MRPPKPDLKRRHADPFSLGQADVVARLGFHAAEQGVFVAGDVDYVGVGHRHVQGGFFQTPVARAEVHAHCPSVDTHLIHALEG